MLLKIPSHKNVNEGNRGNLNKFS